MPTMRRTAARLASGATVAALCLAPAIGSPALAAAKQKAPHHKKTHAPARHPKLATALTMDAARATALKSAAPLMIDAADQARVTGCTAVAGPGYECTLELHAAKSASVCNWSVIVQITDGAPDVVSYSHVACAG